MTDIPQATVRRHQPVTQKPWGHELLFAAVEGAYAGKIITLKAGESVSLQRHQHKSETVHVISGTGRLETGMTSSTLSGIDLAAGTSVDVPATVLHRLSATTELQFIEVSTAQPGWQTDVERVEDRYGRTGTTQP